MGQCLNLLKQNEVQLIQQTSFVTRACQILAEIYLIDYTRGRWDNTLQDVVMWSERAMVEVNKK
jgi:hypothetical protein